MLTEFTANIIESSAFKSALSLASGFKIEGRKLGTWIRRGWRKPMSRMQVATHRNMRSE